MKPIEKTLIIIALIAGGIQPLAAHFLKMDLSYLYDISLIVLLGYFFIPIKSPAVVVAFTLVITGLVGHIIGSSFQIVSHTGTMLFAVVILVTLFRKKEKSVFYLGVAIALLIQAALFLFADPKLFLYGTIVNYFLVGVIGSIKLNKSELDHAIDTGLTFYLIVGVVVIINSTLNIVLSKL